MINTKYFRRIFVKLKVIKLEWKLAGSHLS
jgi:hypothetical protein